MKRDILCDGRPATLVTEGELLRYEREGGSSFSSPFSIEQTAPGQYSVLLSDVSYRVTVGPGGTIFVDGHEFQIEAFDPRDHRARSADSGKHGSAQVTSSMPGKIVRVLVTVGDEVEAGQGLVVVEAMKMQNEMKSPKAGRIADIRTQAGATVTAGEVLVVVE